MHAAAHTLAEQRHQGEVGAGGASREVDAPWIHAQPRRVGDQHADGAAYLGHDLVQVVLRREPVVDRRERDAGGHQSACREGRLVLAQLLPVATVREHKQGCVQTVRGEVVERLAWCRPVPQAGADQQCVPGLLALLGVPVEEDDGVGNAGAGEYSRSSDCWSYPR